MDPFKILMPTKSSPCVSMQQQLDTAAMYMFDVHEISKITPQREKSELEITGKECSNVGKTKSY